MCRVGNTAVLLAVSLLSATTTTICSSFVPVAKWQRENQNQNPIAVVRVHNSRRHAPGSISTGSSTDDEQEKQETLPTSIKLGRRETKRLQQKQEQKLDYERRRDRWMSRYGSAAALKSTFGPSKKWGGDLSPQQTRALYHALLPRSLLGLHELGLMNPEELAPLAYEARLAAKAYARSRCHWSGRLLTAAFDQYRSLRDRGRLVAPFQKPASMSWDEIWEKYEGQIVREECTEVLQLEDGSWQRGTCKFLDEEDQRESLTMRIYLRILEKSCATNQAFDSLFLKNNDGEDSTNKELAAIAAQLEEDVRSILLSSKESEKVEKTMEKMEKEHRKTQEKEEERQEKEDKRQRKAQEKEGERQEKEGERQLKAQEKEEKEQRKAEKKREKAARKEEKHRRKEPEEEEQDVSDDKVVVESHVAAPTPTYSKRWEALRVMAGTRRKFHKLFPPKSRS